jgi:branched-chain amino acid aminotransferase
MRASSTPSPRVPDCESRRRACDNPRMKREGRATVASEHMLSSILEERVANENDTPAYVWWNGKQIRWEDATVHVTELGWSTVGAIFEGIRAYTSTDGSELYVFRLREHLERLEQSMKLVRLRQDYTLEEITQAIMDLMVANEVREDTYIRPLVYNADTSGKRFAQVGAAEAGFLINTAPMETHLKSGMKMTAKVSSWRRISEDVMPPRIKNLSNYRNSQLGSTEARMDGYDTAIFLNSAGTVAEGPGACLGMVKDGALHTPDVTSSILESITRDAIMVLAREVLGIPVIERRIDRTELYTADELFTCGTAAEISPIVSVDHFEVGNGEIGPITHALEAAYDDALRGNENRFSHWRTPVLQRASVGV